MSTCKELAASELTCHHEFRPQVTLYFELLPRPVLRHDTTFPVMFLTISLASYYVPQRQPVTPP